MIYALIHITVPIAPAADTSALEAFIHNFDGPAIQERGNVWAGLPERVLQEQLTRYSQKNIGCIYFKSIPKPVGILGIVFILHDPIAGHNGKCHLSLK